MIKIRRLNMVYNKGKENEVHALKDVSFDLRKGDLVAVTGPSGSGKSTLLHILGGLLPPTCGEYLWGETDIFKLGDGALSRLRNSSIGFVLQDFGLLGERSVMENVCVPMMFSKTPIRRMRARAQECMEKLVIGELSARRVSQLSGGQCQRVAIARALVMDPKLILADEPTGALDSANSQSFMDLLKQVSGGGTTIMVATHNPLIASQCETVYRITDGVLS